MQGRAITGYHQSGKQSEDFTYGLFWLTQNTHAGEKKEVTWVPDVQNYKRNVSCL